MILLEGWCVGLIAEDVPPWTGPINALEAAEDPDGEWFRWSLGELAAYYTPIWDRIALLVSIEVPDLETVIASRLAQERGLAAASGRAGMDEAAVIRFVQHYERFTRALWTGDAAARRHAVPARRASSGSPRCRDEGRAMKIAVVGAGAMGCLYAAAFHRAGAEVTLVDVNAEQIAAINAHGLDLETRAGRESLPIPARLPGEAEGPADLVLVFTKVFHTDAALAGAKHLIGPETWVLTLQNGLGNAERIAAHVAPGKVLVGIASLPADLVGPGRCARWAKAVRSSIRPSGMTKASRRKWRTCSPGAGSRPRSNRRSTRRSGPRRSSTRR